MPTKGNSNKHFFDELTIDGIHLITKIRKNMKGNLMDDMILLRKRALVASVNDEHKYFCMIEHTIFINTHFVHDLMLGITAKTLLISSVYLIKSEIRIFSKPLLTD